MIPMELKSVRAQYDTFIEGIVQDNRRRGLIQEGKQRRSARRFDWLLCELDYQRIVLAGRLARSEFAQLILRAAQSRVFSSGCCG